MLLKTYKKMYVFFVKYGIIIHANALILDVKKINKKVFETP